MTYKIGRAARETVTTTGAVDVTDTLDLGGVTDAHLQTFVAALGTGNSTTVRIISGDNTAWMEAEVTVTDGTPDVLTIDAINASSAAGAGITLAAGTRVFSIIPTDWDDLFDKLYASTLGAWVNDGTIAADEVVTDLLTATTALVTSQGGAFGTVSAIDHYADGEDPETSFPFLALRHALGTSVSPTAVTMDTMLGAIGFYGWQGSGWLLGGSVQAQATENWTGSARGTRLLFSVTPSGTTTPSFPLVLEDDALLLNGDAVLTTATGGATNFSEGGTWAGASAYTKGTFVTRLGKRYLASEDIAAPAGTPGLDGEVHVSAGAGVNMTLTGLNTSGTADTIVVVSAWNHDGTSITGITSDSGLVFTQASSAVKTVITGHRTRVEVWTAPSPGALVGEDITITYSNTNPTSKKAVAFGVYGGDIGDPFDANANSKKTSSGDRTAPGVTGLSTTTADDLLIFVAASDSDGNTGLVASSAPSTWTLLNYQGNATNDTASNVINLAVSYKLVSATQSAISISDGGDPSCWAAIGIAIKASGATNLAPTLDSRWILVDNGDTTPAFASSDLDSVLGSTRGAIPYRGASGWTSRNPGTSGYVWTSSGTGADPDWAPSAGGGSATGNTPILPKIYRPTKAGSGFNNTLIGSGATSVDTDVGILFTGGASTGGFSYKTAPTAPYEFTALLSAGPVNGGVPFFGFSDGTKYQVMYAPNITFTDSGKTIVISYSSLGVFNATHATVITGTHGDYVWMRIGDDGTNVYFKVSLDGVNFVTIYTVAKASGYLGSSGYTRVVFGTSANTATTTLMSFDDGTGTLGSLVTGSGGLFRSVASATPTAASTGLSTWQNQGTASAVDDASVGIVLTVPAGAGDNVRIRKKTAPATPYTITAGIALEGTNQNFQFAGIGWTDGTKLHLICIKQDGTIEVGKWSTVSAFSAADAGETRAAQSNPYWLQISDDGTNVYFRISADGKTFRDVFSVAKASGYLGGSGYTSVMFCANRQNSVGTSTAYATLMSYKQA